MRCAYRVAWLILVCGVAPAAAEDLVFPADAGVVDVTQAPYHAKGDGSADDTEAIQQALNAAAAGKGHLIYLPNGTYRISDTLRWAGRQTRDVLQGQSEAGTIIKLADRCPGYTDPSKPRAMVWTGEFPPQRFRNAIRNLTFDTGKGNPGAIGVRFNASNQGQMCQVTIRSGDGSGPIGLDMGYTSDVGPLFIKHLHVVGFDVGIYTAYVAAAQTLEHITLENQNVCGWVNDGQALAVRKLTSRNRATAFFNKTGSGMVTLLDSELKGEGDASAAAAIVNNAGLFARNVATPGYRLAIDSRQGPGQSVNGTTITEYTSHPVLSQFASPTRSLNLPIEETPEVPWDDLKDWVSVAKFPPKEVTLQKERKEKNGAVKKIEVKVLDWTDSIQQAIDSGASTVYFPRDNGTKSRYEVLGTVHLRSKLRRLIGLENPFGTEGTGVFQLDEGAAPAVIIERFDWNYTPLSIRAVAKRTLVISAIPGAHLEVAPGGRAFIEDVVTKFKMGPGSQVWIRQFNTEYTNEKHANSVQVETPEAAALIKKLNGPAPAPTVSQRSLEGFATATGTVNSGGKLWVLGIKTEGDGTLLTTLGGGKTEVLGGLIYANKNYYPEKKAFVVSDGALCFSFRELVTRQQPFNMVAELRGGESRVLKPNAGPGGLFVLYTGYTGAGEVSPTTEKAAAALLPAAKGTGLRGEYFAGRDFTDLQTTRTDATIDFDWTSAAPAAGLTPDRYSVRWTGQIEPRVTGPHTFQVDPDGTRLMVDGRVVVDAWSKPVRYRFGQIWLEAGKRYDIKLERSCDRDRAKVTLAWSAPGLRRETVPASQVYPATDTLPTVSLAAASTTLNENGPAGTLTLSRSGDVARPLTVNLAPRVNLAPLMAVRWAARGDAVAGRHYKPLLETFVIPAGEQAVTFPLAPIHDKRPGPDTKAVFDLAFSPNYNTAGGPAVVTIQESDNPPRGSGVGLTAEYFARADFTTLKATRVDETIDFAWDKKAPVPGLELKDGDNFRDPKVGYSVRWCGQMQPLFSETYRIAVPATKYGSVAVWLDGKQIIASAKGDSAPRSAQVALEAGKKYDLKIEYVNQNFYGSFVRLLWSSPSQFEQVVPRSQLYAPSAD